MKPLLVVEGAPRASRERAAARGIASGSALYVAALRDLFPDVPCEVLCAADANAVLPSGTSLGDYSGVAIGGSPLHAYDQTPEVERQLQFVQAAALSALPVLGSCWGLQIAAVLAGGRVERCGSGREIGLARKITREPAGRDHPLLAGKGDCFDALCIHYDGVMALGNDSQILARNAHSSIQAAIIPLGRTQVWGLQYHPEFDLAQIASLLQLYGPDMIEQGFFANPGELAEFVGRWKRLSENPDNAGIAWQLGIDQDTLSAPFRRLEIRNWVEHCVLHA